MAGYDDYIRQAMQGLGITPPDDGYKLPALPAEPVRQESSPVPESAYGSYAQQEMRTATPLAREIQPGNRPTPTADYIDPNSGEMTTKGKERMDNPMMGFDTGGVGAIRAWHGSPHLFDKFDMSKIGTGTRVAAQGEGLYFAGREGHAREIRDSVSGWSTAPEHEDKLARLIEQVKGAEMKVRDAYEEAQMAFDAHNAEALQQRYERLAAEHSRLNAMLEAIPKKSTGHMYEVNLNVEPHQLLNWDIPLREQSNEVRRAAAELGYGGDTYGEDIIRSLSQLNLAPRDLHDAGIPGLRYTYYGHPSQGNEAYNYVMYNDALIDILRKYGIAGLTGSAAAGGALSGQQDQTQ